MTEFEHVVADLLKQRGVIRFGVILRRQRAAVKGALW
jgi:hypothetical protein